MDQVRGQVPVGHLLAPIAADAGFPRRSVGKGMPILSDPRMSHCEVKLTNLQARSNEAD